MPSNFLRLAPQPGIIIGRVPFAIISAPIIFGNCGVAYTNIDSSGLIKARQCAEYNEKKLEVHLYIEVKRQEYRCPKCGEKSRFYDLEEEL